MEKSGDRITNTKDFSVEGMTCIDCADRVEAAVGRVAGVSACHVDPASGELVVFSEEANVPDEHITQAVRRAGYRLADEDLARSGPVVGFVRFVLSKTESTLAAVAALLTIGGLIAAVAQAPDWLRIALFAAAMVGGGIPVARHALQELWLSHTVGINGLMVIAVVGATLIGQWAEAAIVVVLFSLGEALEGFAAHRARSALSGLLALAPPIALKVLPDGGTEEVAVEELAVGDRVLVRPGDRVSVDGVVRAGRGAVDQSPITGESLPVEKEPGDEVFAGTVNTTGALEVEMTRPAADNTLNRMVSLVQEAQSRQAPVQRFVDRFARIYTPAVAGVAALVAAVPPLLLGQPFWGENGWLMRALQMLVIACPCALVISTPVSLVSAMTNAAGRGVLVKGGRVLEALNRVKAFAFDKTGTLTEGRPVTTDVLAVCSCGECVEDCGLRHAAALELQSSHPLAQALVEEAREREVEVPPAEEVTVMSGRGVEGVVEGARVTVASHAHFDERVPHSAEVCRLADGLAAEGKTVILVRHDDEVCSVFGVADKARPDSRGAVAELRSMGLHTIMLSGDSPTVAARIGQEVGIDEVHGGLLPEEKVAAVSNLAETYGDVAMVGDGVNDAPALAQAQVGIAMGGAGSAQAMETADVVLMGDDLTQIPFVLRLSRRARRTVMANIGLALGVKAAVFGLAAAGLASLWMAVLADVGASLVVIVNGLRLRGWRNASHNHS